MSSRLIFVTQRVDTEDPVLGATVAKIAAVAERFDEIVVFTDSAVPGTLPANCRIRTFAARTKLGRELRFGYGLVAELAQAPRPVAVLAHMCPIYAVLAAPVARPLGVRVLLWYAQWHRTRVLDLAARLSTAVVSVDRSTIPIESSRSVGIGHGIDMALFACGSGTTAGPPLEAVALGRYGESKGLPAIVRAIAIARTQGADLRLTCHGTASGASDERTREELRWLVDELDLGDAVTLGGPIARSEVPALLARSGALINNTRSGAPDKVVFEACASCLPVLLSSPPLRPLVDGLGATLFFPTDDAEQLAQALVDLAGKDAATRVAIGRSLRERVKTTNSTDSWADAITRLANGQSASASV